MRTKMFSLPEIAARRVPAILEDTKDGTRWEIVQHELGGLFIGRLVSSPVAEPVLWRWRETTGGRRGVWEITNCEPSFSTTGHGAGRTWEKQALVPTPLEEIS